MSNFRIKHLAKGRVRDGTTACGKEVAVPRTTHDPSAVSCGPCSKTIHMADAEARVEVERSQRRTMGFVPRKAGRR